VAQSVYVLWIKTPIHGSVWRPTVVWRQQDVRAVCQMIRKRYSKKGGCSMRVARYEEVEEYSVRGGEQVELPFEKEKR